MGAEASRARYAEAADHARRQPGQLEGRVRGRVEFRVRVRGEGRGWKELAPNPDHQPSPKP